ncbi:SAM-dependent methyltransferase [Spirillospora sp. NPDC048823]|uniref:SAM-dependent methyltransferase n=1 Tax=unclassified Spirillospora TaxID=2642701 RepID=UPI003710BA36
MTGGDADSSWNPSLPTVPEFDWPAAIRDLGDLGTSMPSMPRLWNFWAGGKDNFLADRRFGERVEALYPRIVDMAHYRIAFRARVVRTLVGEHGIGQLLVAGTDLPLRDEVHHVAQQVDPMVRVAYADPDPLVMAHARALLNSTWSDACEHIEAGLEDPAALLEGVQGTLDLAEPVGVLLINSLDGLNETTATRALDVLCAALPRGSCIAICNLTGATCRGLATLGAAQGIRVAGLPNDRAPADVRALFAGLDLVDPGVVSLPHWRPEPSPWPRSRPVDVWCGVGRVPGARPDRRRQ